jgi:kinesin family protein 6/9
MILQLKSLKNDYKKLYAEWRTVKSDVDYCEKLVSQCRERFLVEFERYYEDTYGALLNGSSNEHNEVRKVGSNDKGCNGYRRKV